MKSHGESQSSPARHDRAMLGLAAVLTLCLSVTALGQRGVGDDGGVAQWRTKPETMRLSGKLEEIDTGPCGRTTGRAQIGTHLVLRTK